MKYFSVFVFTIAFILFSIAATAQVSQINEAEFLTLSKKANVVILDVRTPDEVSGGYLKGTTLFFNYYDNDFASKVQALDKSKEYVVYCRSGARSNKAAQIMADAGIKKVHNLQGGITGWKDASHITRK
jgi:rhodanese-related sulfurtransferase